MTENFRVLFKVNEAPFTEEGSYEVTYYVCDGCGYATKRPYPVGLDLYYSKGWQAPPRTHVCAANWVKLTTDANCIHPMDAAVLDVGSRDRGLVDELGAAVGDFWDPNTSGPFLGTESFTRPERPAHQLVCACHVLEHVPDVRLFMSDMMALTKNYIFLEVPSPELETLDGSNDDICRTHLHHFPLTALQALARSCGLYVLRADMEDSDGHKSNRVLLAKQLPDYGRVMTEVYLQQRKAYINAVRKVLDHDPEEWALYGKSDAYHKLCNVGGSEVERYCVFDLNKTGLSGIEDYSVMITPRQPEVRQAIKDYLSGRGVRWIDLWD